MDLTQQQEAKVKELLDKGWFWNVVHFVRKVGRVSFQEAFKYVEDKAR